MKSRLVMPLDHAGVSVADLERSVAFYRDAFALETVEDRFELPGRGFSGIVLSNTAGARLELFFKTGSAPSGLAIDPIEAARRQGWFQVAFRTNDLEAAFAQVVAAGGAPVRAPFVAPDGKARVAFVADPDGNLLELIERPR